MKRFRGAAALIALLYALAGTSGCFMVHDAYIHGSGQLATDTRELPGFSTIESRGSANVTVRIGAAPSVIIEADDNLLPRIMTEVSDGRLIIETEGSLYTSHGIEVVVVTPSIDAVTISGSGNVEIPEIAGEQLDLVVRGSGEIRAAGVVDRLSVSIQGSGDVDLNGLVTRSASASIAGSGDITLHVTEELNASIAGSGNILYAGGAKNVREQIAGSGEVRPI